MSATAQELQTQIGQLSTTLNQLKQQGSRRFPSQTLINLKENAKCCNFKKWKKSTIEESYDLH